MIKHETMKGSLCLPPGPWNGVSSVPCTEEFPQTRLICSPHWVCCFRANVLHVTLYKNVSIFEINIYGVRRPIVAQKVYLKIHIKMKESYSFYKNLVIFQDTFIWIIYFPMLDGHLIFYFYKFGPQISKSKGNIKMWALSLFLSKNGYFIYSVIWE